MSILQTDCPIGGENEFSHNFFISSIPDITWRSSFGIPVVNVFTFVHGSTSGYPGSGPQVHEEIYKLIKENEDEIAIRRLLITGTEHKELQDYFSSYGPILTLLYPHRMSPVEE